MTTSVPVNLQPLSWVRAAPSLVESLCWESEWCTSFRDWLLAHGDSALDVQSTLQAVQESFPSLSQLSQLDWLMAPALSQLAQRGDLSARTTEQHAAQLAKLQEFRRFLEGKGGNRGERWPWPRRFYTLPQWLRAPLRRYLQCRQRHWPAHSAQQQTQNVVSHLSHLFDFFLTQYHWSDWSQLSVRWVDAYLDAGLQRGLQLSTLNVAQCTLQMFCRFLREEGYAVPQPLTQLKRLTLPRYLPRPLTDDQIRRLEQHIHAALRSAADPAHRQQATMDLAWFYLLWHCGLRVGEVQRLTVDDLDLNGRKLLVRTSKERKDRVVYLSDTTVSALRQHLQSRADAETREVFTYHQRRISIRTLHRRLAKYGRQIQLAVSPHRLRHTFATQMLNAGMPITSLQRYLGHENLDTTMVYAAVSDRSLRTDYYQGVMTFDPSSASLVPAASKAVLRRLLADLQTAEQTPAQRQAVLEQMQHLLDEALGR